MIGDGVKEIRCIFTGRALVTQSVVACETLRLTKLTCIVNREVCGRAGRIAAIIEEITTVHAVSAGVDGADEASSRAGDALSCVGIGGEWT